MIIDVRACDDTAISSRAFNRFAGVTGDSRAAALSVLRWLESFRSRLPGSFNEFVSQRSGHIKILDLFFYGQGNRVAARKLWHIRLRQIKKLGALLEKDGINTRFLAVLLNEGSLAFPLQLAVEIDRGRVVKLKVYFSNVLNDTCAMVKVINRVCRVLRRPRPPESCWTVAEGIDCFGIDFCSDGGIRLKIYSLYQHQRSTQEFREIARTIFARYGADGGGLPRFFALTRKHSCRAFGFLFRVDGARVDGVKCWYRLADPMISRFPGLRLSYLTCGEGKIERYFRSERQGWDEIEHE